VRAGTGGVSAEEMSEGLEHNYRILGLVEPVIFSHEDFEAFTQGFRLCNADGELDQRQFENCVHLELVRYTQRCTAARMQRSVQEHADDQIQFLALKLQLATGLLANAAVVEKCGPLCFTPLCARAHRRARDRCGACCLDRARGAELTLPPHLTPCPRERRHVADPSGRTRSTPHASIDDTGFPLQTAGTVERRIKAVEDKVEALVQEQRDLHAALAGKIDDLTSALVSVRAQDAADTFPLLDPVSPPPLPRTNRTRLVPPPRTNRTRLARFRCSIPSPLPDRACCRWPARRPPSPAGAFPRPDGLGRAQDSLPVNDGKTPLQVSLLVDGKSPLPLEKRLELVEEPEDRPLVGHPSSDAAPVEPWLDLHDRASPSMSTLRNARSLRDSTVRLTASVGHFDVQEASTVAPVMVPTCFPLALVRAGTCLRLHARVSVLRIAQVPPHGAACRTGAPSPSDVPTSDRRRLALRKTYAASVGSRW
jgi:hypothetical protein